VYKIEVSNCVKVDDKAPPSPDNVLLWVCAATVVEPPDPPPPKDIRLAPLLESLI
jgi:hypothetical protein